MSIGFLKRLLALAKFFAVLVIAGAVYGYIDHRSAMAKPYAPPDFRPTVLPPTILVPPIESLQKPIGRYPQEVERVEEPKEEVKTEDIQTALDRLCTITNAVVVYEPYNDVYPSIVVKFKQKPAGQTEDTRTIRVGEALIERPHKLDPNFTVPYRYRFVRCEPDPEHPGWTYFVFDMNCDGTDIQKARWKLETEETSPLKPAVGEADEEQRTHSDKGFFVGVRPGSEEQAPEKPAEAAAPEVPVETEPVAPPIITTAEPTGALFEEEDGVQALTREGVDYLKDNYQKILEGARTQTYRDRNGNVAGVRILGIRESSIANQFGILKDDVILSINGIKVTDQANAVNVVKAELKKAGMRYITVRILRRGRELERRFDSRDPDTRRMAKNIR